MNPSSNVPDKVKVIHWNLAQQKNTGQSIIALLLAKSNARDDKEHSAPVLSDKVIWWRQMVELAASLVAEIALKPFFSPKEWIMIYGSPALRQSPTGLTLNLHIWARAHSL